MIAGIGFGALVITFMVSLYGIGAAVYGARNNDRRWVESARLAMLLTFPLISISTLSLIYLLVTGRFEYEFVSSVTSRSMPVYLRITSLWGGQSGSLIFWSWLLSAFASAVTLRKWDRDQEFLPWVIVVSLVTLAFFISLNIFFENPFRSFWRLPSGDITIAMTRPQLASLFVPRDGRGLNPLLRHPGMIINPGRASVGG